VGYAASDQLKQLPKIKTGVLSPIDALPLKAFNDTTHFRLNLLYAKDYHTSQDLSILWKGWRGLGRS